MRLAEDSVTLHLPHFWTRLLEELRASNFFFQCRTDILPCVNLPLRISHSSISFLTPPPQESSKLHFSEARWVTCFTHGLSPHAVQESAVWFGSLSPKVPNHAALCNLEDSWVFHSQYHKTILDLSPTCPVLKLGRKVIFTDLRTCLQPGSI